MLTLLPTPIGNIEDITLRALRVLERAEIFLCEDTRVAKKLLQLLSERHGLAIRTPRFIALHSHNEKRFLEALDPSFFDREVVYMSDAGMPGISDPGAMLVRYCQQNGLDYTVLPGPTAFATAYAASGFLSPRFLFYGFLPHKGLDREKALTEVLASSYPVILYESPHRLEKLLDALVQKAPERTLFLAKELSKRHERYFFGRAETIARQITGTLLKGEWVVVIAPDEAPRNRGSIDVEEILTLSLPPKQKAKLLAKMTGESVKSWYARLMESGA